MARINVDDSVFQDARFFKLVLLLGNQKLAVGELVWAWRLGQKWFLTENKGIPRREWVKQDCNDAIIEAGLATEESGFINIIGREKHFGWLKQKQKAGKKGGQASANVRLAQSSGANPPYSLLSSLNSDLSAACSSESKRLQQHRDGSLDSEKLLVRGESCLSPGAVALYRDRFGGAYKQEVESCWLRFEASNNYTKYGGAGFVTALNRWWEKWLEKKQEAAAKEGMRPRPINYDEDGNQIPWPSEVP